MMKKSTAIIIIVEFIANTGANGAFYLIVNMAVQISGVLKDGAGKPIQKRIQLKAKQQHTVVVNVYQKIG